MSGCKLYVAAVILVVGMAQAATAAVAAGPVAAMVVMTTASDSSENLPISVRRAVTLADAGNIDLAVSTLRRALTGLTPADRARAVYELGLTETGLRVTLTRLVAAADSDPGLKARAWLAAGEALLLADRPDSARPWFVATRALKGIVAGSVTGGGARSSAAARNGAAFRDDAAIERAAFLVAASAMASQEWAEGRFAYSDYLVGYPGGDYQAAARIGIALANERLDRSQEAAEIYRAVLVQHRGFDDEPWLLDHLAQLIDSSAPQEAQQLKKRLEEEYPEYRASVRTTSATADVVTTLPPIATRPPATASPATSGAWSLQVGAFRDRERADMQERRFRVRGWRTELVTRAGLFVVYAGRYASRDAAQAVVADAVRIAGQDVMPARR